MLNAVTLACYRQVVTVTGCDDFVSMLWMERLLNGFLTANSLQLHIHRKEQADSVPHNVATRPICGCLGYLRANWALLTAMQSICNTMWPHMAQSPESRNQVSADPLNTAQQPPTHDLSPVLIAATPRFMVCVQVASI